VKRNIYIRIIVILLIAILSFECSKNGTEFEENTHFDFVLYDGLTLNDISDISEELESNYQRIVNDLQVQDMPHVTARIWANYDNFLTAMEADLGVRYNGATGYVFGMEEFRIYYINPAPLTALHEFAHLVSMQVNESIPNNPRWLWEAVALYESRDFINPITLPYMVSGNYPTLEELNIDYNSSNHSVYSVGYIILEYIIQIWGMDAVIRLIETNGNTEYILGLTVQEFESGWYQFIEEEYLN